MTPMQRSRKEVEISMRKIVEREEKIFRVKWTIYSIIAFLAVVLSYTDIG